MDSISGVATPGALTTAQKYFFEANGYLIVENALTPDELQTVRRSADAAEERWRADPDLPGFRRDDLEQVLGCLANLPVLVVERNS